MSEERKKVLEMLAEGKISTEEAERLLEKLQEVGARGQGRGHRGGRGLRFRKVRYHQDEDQAKAEESDEEPKVHRPRFLRVVVEGDENVNIRVPLKLIRTGIKLGAMLPTDAQDKIEAKGIDLGSFSDMDADELISSLNELTVDVEDGKETVRIFCE